MLSDKSYKEMTAHYKTVDGCLAIAFYVMFLILYLLMGILYSKKHIYLGIPINLILLLICVGIVLMRHQKLSTIGLTQRNIKKSLLWGFIFGLVISLVNIIPSILSGDKPIGFGGIMYNIFYYFIIIAFTEEVVFRGFIQTRIYGIIKSDIVAILVCGLLFSAMHIPFQMYNANLSLVAFMQNNYISLILLVLWHVIFNFLYRKYNSIVAPTIFHGFMDFSGNLLK